MQPVKSELLSNFNTKLKIETPRTSPTRRAPLVTAVIPVTPARQTATFHFCLAIGKPSEAIDSIGRYTLIVSISCSALRATCPPLPLEVR